MSDPLHTLITALLPPSCALGLTEVTVVQAHVLLQLTATAPTACCPRCAVPSSAVHSRYQRQLTDLPWGTRAVHIRLTVRKFVCRQPTCARRIFTERLPDLVAPSARKTTRLIAVLRAIGIALGGQAGARLAASLRLRSSAAMLLRLVWRAPTPPMPTLQAVGVDEWRSCRRRARWVAIDEAVHTLRTQGTPIATLARQLGISRPTVYAYLRRDTPPGRSAASSPDGGVRVKGDMRQRYKPRRLPALKDRLPVRCRAPWSARLPSSQLTPRCT
jgi:transposase